MDIDQDAATSVTKKKVDKSESSSTSPQKVDTKKSDKTSDSDDPKPRIVLTFRSEKPGAKTSTMKIVPTEDKHEDMSLRRSSRTRTKQDHNNGGPFPSPDKDVQPVSESDETSDNSHTTSTPKRSSRRRSKEGDNIIANAIARKEKSYNQIPAPSRPSRRIKPTAKVLANEELRLESQSTRSNQDKSADDGTPLRRSGRVCRYVSLSDLLPWSPHKKTRSRKPAASEAEGETADSQSQVLKLKHLCELGLKARSPEGVEEAENPDKKPEAELIEIDDDLEDEDEVDDDSEVISKLLEDDADTACDSEAEQSRKTSTDDEEPDSDYSYNSDPVEAAPRRSTRKRKDIYLLYPDQIDEKPIASPCKKRSTRAPAPASASEDNSRQTEEHDEVSEPAGAEEGPAAACPADDAAVIARCMCEDPSAVYPAQEDLTEPVFCQAIDVVDGVRVGCSHAARRSRGSYAPMLRAGPRAPYMLLCTLHTQQLRKHMGCPACGLFCTQGTFYRCSLAHFFHVDCGLPYNESSGRAGCPHCGVSSYRWQPANRDTTRVSLTQHCSNQRVYLPEQREQWSVCSDVAYLGFSTHKPQPPQPVIPPDLLPSSVDLKTLAKPEGGDVTMEELIDAINKGESAEQLVAKIAHGPSVSGAAGAAAAVSAAARGHLAALCLLQYAGADLGASHGERTPLLAAVSALLEKPDTKSPKKMKPDPEKDTSEEIAENSKEESMEVDIEKTETEDKEAKESEKERPSDEDLMKVIKYLVAAGCDVNVQGPDGMTALHIAAQHGSTDVCSALLESADAAVDARDHGGWSPLVWAAENDHHHVVRLLLWSGADALCCDGEGNAAAHWCSCRGAARALALLLARAPHAAHALNKHTDTPLHVAAREGHYACVVVLLANGARTDVENASGELPVEVCSGPSQAAISLSMQMTIAKNAAATRTRLLDSDISRGREPYPIPCVNEVDEAPLPEFVYVTEHVTPASVTLDTSLQTMQGCTCLGACGACCACSVLGVQPWWARGRLKPAFPYHDPPMLFECNQTCRCDQRTCDNNVLTRLLRTGSVFIRCCVFRTPSRGWGLRTTQAVARGTPLAVYTGELITVTDADARANDQYMFALDVKPDLLEQCSDRSLLCVDACVYGSGARFMNHSCAPAAAPVRVFAGARDLRRPHVALVATRDLAPGDELTFDYGDKFWSVKSKWMKCECGTPECRYTTLATDNDKAE